MMKIRNLLIGVSLFSSGLLMGSYLSSSDKPDNYLFVKACAEYRYDCLEAADAYIINSQKLLEEIKSTNENWDDTYGESDAYALMEDAYAKYNSLLIQEQ